MTSPGRPENVVHVRDSDDPRLSDYRHIRDRGMRSTDDGCELFVGEQALVVRRMLSIPSLTRSVLTTENGARRLAPHVPPDVPLFVAPQQVLDRIVGFHIHRGVLAIGYRPKPESLSLDAVVPRHDGPLTLLLCDGINNIDNIGMLFRNAAAFGVDAVVLSPPCHDPLYRKSLRVSIGHALTVPWARSRDWADDLSRLKSERDVTLIGAESLPEAVPLNEAPRPRRVGLVVGQEYEGLSDQSRRRCDFLVRIPMACGVESLNVAVAAAVCLHHFSNGPRR